MLTWEHKTIKKCRHEMNVIVYVCTCLVLTSASHKLPQLTIDETYAVLRQDWVLRLVKKWLINICEVCINENRGEVDVEMEMGKEMPVGEWGQSSRRR